MRRLFVLALFLLLTASIVTVVESVFASSIPKPSVPEFKIYLVNHPYDVAPVSPVYTTDPYNGEQKLVTPGSAGYHMDNVSIELWILNQQPSYSNGTTTFTPYYAVRTKGHFEQNWTDLGYCQQREYMLNSNNTRTYLSGYKPAQTDYTYTVLTYSSTVPAQYYFSSSVTYPANTTVDFQVRAVIGHNATVIRYESHIIISFPYEDTGIALDAQSDWSETQSITLTQPLANNSILASTLENPIKQAATTIPIPTDTPEPTATPIQTPTLTPTQTPTLTPTLKPASQNTNLEQTAITLMAIGIAVLATVLVFFLKGKQKGDS